MKKFLKYSYLLVVFILLSGCKFTQPLEWFYYDRIKFVFNSEHNDKQTIYLCRQGETEKETKNRANEANTYFSDEQEKLVNKFAEGLLKRLENSDDDKAGFVIGEVQANLDLQNQVEKLMADVEKVYQCTFIGLESE